MTGIDSSKLCFDGILVRKAGDNYNAYALDEFLALPIDERISMIMERRIRFFAGEVEVPVYEAMKSLNEARA